MRKHPALSSLRQFRGPLKKLIKNSHSQSNGLSRPFGLIPSQPSTSILLKPLESFEDKTVEPVVYQVDILSNWGDPEKIACSAIWFLDEQRHLIKPMKISSIPFSNQEVLSKLSGVSLVKGEENMIWHSKWPPEDANTITLVFFLPSNQKPEYTRIWNTTSLGDASVKKVRVLCGEEELFIGEIPRCYGTDVHLCNNFIKPAKTTFSIQDILGIKQSPAILKDKYGIIPLKPIKQVEISILANYGGQQYFGLNALDFYDENYEIIPWSEIDDIKIKNCANFTDPKKLFKDIKETCDDNDMFAAEFDKEKKTIPKISILFKNPVFVSQIVFWNYNGCARGTIIGAKYVRISMHNVSKWSGKIKKGLSVKENVGAIATAIWLIDIDELYKKEYKLNH